MSGERTPQVVRLLTGIGLADPGQWNACAGADNPFVQHAFLLALEESGSAIAATGWQPVHLVVEDADGGLLAAAPMYRKSHSRGEYVFDHAWAEAYERAGGRYFPKLQVAVPFSPVPGPRLLVRGDLTADERTATLAALIGGMEQAAGKLGCSSIHVTFPDEAGYEELAKAGWLRRTGIQFHWHNNGYGSFDDFLGALNSRKRKAVRKERREVAESSVELFRLTGSDIRPEHWDAFYRFYLDTSDRKWGSPYLTREFLHQLGRTMADQVLLVMCRDGGEWVAGALNLIGSDTLYGRNWGSDGSYRFLHFEACYYQAIEFAIERGLKRVEAGAQGEHKIQRGYLPVRTFSAHWVADAGFHQALDDYLKRERRAIEHHLKELGQESPYRQVE